MPQMSAYDIHVEELDETFQQAAPPEGIKVHLWSHQLTLLHRCKQYENQKLMLKDFNSLRSTHPNLAESDYLRTQVGVIGDKVGSGKSYVVLALIKDNDITNLGSTIKTYGRNKVVMCYAQRNVNVRTNLLVVPHNLVSQWETYITNFSDDIKYLVVSKQKQLETLQENIGNMNDYDLVLVSTTSYQRVAQILTSRSLKMQRIIYDEVDNMNLPSCMNIDSNFYWFVSASYGNLLYPQGVQQARPHHRYDGVVR